MAWYFIHHYFIRDGHKSQFADFQRQALPIVSWHGGEIVSTFHPVQSGSETPPDEIHILKFPSPEAYLAYAQDPDLARLEDLKQNSVEKMTVFQSGEEIDYGLAFATRVSINLPDSNRTLVEKPDLMSTYVVPPLADGEHPAQRPQTIDTVFAVSLNPAQKKLSRLVLQWQKAQDRRVVFAHTYLLMTTNMLQALDAGEYQDRGWVARLLERFADYYFEALEHYEQAWFSAPPVWRVAFQVAENPQSMTVQNLLLGVNAHINHDLVQTLIDLLQDEWPSLSPADKRRRYEDHTYVNQVIARTMEATQEEIINRYSPVLDALSKVSFNMDFVVVSHLINSWREQVWTHAVQYLDLQNWDQKHSLLERVEYTALRRADVIMLKQGPFKMKGLE